MKAAVIGAGSWGTAVARLVAAYADVALRARRPELADRINETHENADYLPGTELADSITATHDLEQAVAGAQTVIMGVPSHGYRQVLTEAAQFLRRDVPVVSLAKGIEVDTLLRMTEVTHEVLPDHDPDVIGVLSGPNLAKEIGAGQPSATVGALASEVEAARL